MRSGISPHKPSPFPHKARAPTPSSGSAADCHPGKVHSPLPRAGAETSRIPQRCLVTRKLLLTLSVKVNPDFRWDGNLVGLSLSPDFRTPLIPATPCSVAVEMILCHLPPWCVLKHPFKFHIRFRRNYGNTSSIDKFRVKITAPLGTA